MDRVLIVEDEDRIIPTIVAALKPFEVAHDRAFSLECARRLFRQHRYDLVMLDLKIPADASGAFPDFELGIEFLTEVRNGDHNPRVPVVTMTSHVEEGLLMSARLRDLGSDHTVPKSLPPHCSLYGIIKEVLASCEARDATPSSKTTKAPLRRGSRLATIERLIVIMERHAKSAAEHARWTRDRKGDAELLKRPSYRALGKAAKVSASTVVRCMKEDHPEARRLRHLYDNAADIYWVLAMLDKRA